MTFEDTKTQNEKSKDTYYTMSILVFALGVVAFLPWSFITPAHDYWMYKFRNTSINDSSSEFRTPLQTDFASVYSISMEVTNVFTLTLAVIYGHKFGVRARITTGLILVLALFTLLAALVKVDADSWQLGFFVLTMVIGVVIAATNSLYSISTMVMLANFPQKYLALNLNGHSIAAILSAALQLLSLAVGMSIENDALLYFGLGSSLIALTLALFVYTTKNPFYLHHMKNYREGRQNRVSFDKVKGAMKKIWIPIVALLVTIVVDIALNPSVSSLVVSEGEGGGEWNDVYFVPTITFLLCGVSGLAGRAAASIMKTDIGEIPMLIFSILRLLVFVPLVMLCNAQPRNHLPVVFPHDYQYIIIWILFNFTHGYVFIALNLSIRKLVKVEELDAAYQIVLATIGISMALFSFTGILCVKIL